MKYDISDKILFLDLETDSLDVSEANIKFVGCMDENGNAWMQEWNDKTKEELIKKIDSSHKIITFNGEAYDLPILSRHGISIPHWQHIDVYNVFKKRAPLIRSGGFKSYSLKNLIKEVGIKTDGKGTIDYHIFMKDKWTPEEYAEIYAYLKQDLVVTKQLWDYLIQKFDNLKGFINEQDAKNYKHITSSTGAYGYKAICHSLGLKEEYIDGDNHAPYQGAYVMDPLKESIKGDSLYLDYSSLYPMMYVHSNLFSSNCLCCKPEEKWHGNEMFQIQGKYCSKQQGKIEQLIKKFYLQRKEYKKQKDGREFAIKIILNSIYGCSSKESFKHLYSNYTASDCTSLARQSIKHAIDQLNKEKFEVVYGDSVAGETKVILQKGRKIFEEDIKNLFDHTDNINLNKEYNFKKGIKVLTLDEKGKSVFKPIKYVMRHHANKKMYRVHFTNNWHIDVTEDHSLMGYQNLGYNNCKKRRVNPMKRIIELKPEEIGKKAKSIISLKKIPIINSQSKNFPILIYEFMGYFIGDGSFDRKKILKQKNKNYYLNLALGLDYVEVINRLIIPLQKMGYIKNYILSKSRKGDIKMNGLSFVKLIVKHCRSYNGDKIIPKWLFKEKDKNICAFLRGLFSADGGVMIRNKNPIIKVTSVKDDYIKEIRKLLYKCGIAHSVFKENTVNKYKTLNKVYCSGTYSKNIIIQSREDFIKKIGFILKRKNDLSKIHNGRFTSIKNLKGLEFDTKKVLSVELIDAPNYVYDIEVDKTHRFFANYVLVHNTDSCIVNLNGKTKEDCLALAKKISYDISHAFPFPWEEFDFKLEDEIDYIQFFKDKTGALIKKNYIYINKKGKMTIKGLDVIKKNCSDLGLHIFENHLKKKILERKDCLFPKEYIDGLIKESIEKNKLIISKTFNIKDHEEYKSKTSIYNLIKEKYGTGEVKMIKNHKLGAGKGVKYCSLEEAKDLDITDLDLDDVYKELSPFIIDFHALKAKEKLEKMKEKRLLREKIKAETKAASLIDKQQTKLFN